MMRTLRIAVSVLCVVAAVKLIALWIHSYETSVRGRDLIWGNLIRDRQSYMVSSTRGRVVFLFFREDGVNRWSWTTGRNGGHLIKEELLTPAGDKSYYEPLTGFGWAERPVDFETGLVDHVPGRGDVLISLGSPAVKPIGVGPIVPYWFLVLLTLIVGAAVNISWPLKFHLRGLIIAVAVVACLLALHVTLDG